ncbi:MAG: winged helix-turn-helix transcriptional regulator [Candidatus Nanohaloarchaea archaeon]
MTDGICSIVESFDMIGSKWKLIILNDLAAGEKRFNQLKRSTEASSRTLSRTLKDLQEDGLVEKREGNGNPIATYYSLTEKGLSLKPVFKEINAWAEKWLETR